MVTIPIAEVFIDAALQYPLGRSLFLRYGSVTCRNAGGAFPLYDFGKVKGNWSRCAAITAMGRYAPLRPAGFRIGPGRERIDLVFKPVNSREPDQGVETCELQ